MGLKDTEDDSGRADRCMITWQRQGQRRWGHKVRRMVKSEGVSD